jgi:hypothetical protein
MKIALAILAYNAQDYLVDDVHTMGPFVDEIRVALDSKTTDNSVAILKELREEIGHDKLQFQMFKWEHSFSKAKNFSLSLVSPDVDWVIALAEDNIISTEGMRKLVEFLKTVPPDVYGVRLPRKCHHPHKSLDEENYIKESVPPYCCVFRRFDGHQCLGRVHEDWETDIINKGHKVITYGEVFRHIHWFNGEVDTPGVGAPSIDKYFYYKVLSHLPESWTPGDPIGDDTREAILDDCTSEHRRACVECIARAIDKMMEENGDKQT